MSSLIKHVPVYEAPQFQQLMDEVQSRYPISCLKLMKDAGVAACDFLIHRWPNIKKIMVFCGRGDNGGQGYVLAEQAHQRGLAVTVWQVRHGLTPTKPEKMHDEVWEVMESCYQRGVPLLPYSNEVNLDESELIVDAIFGIGLRGRVSFEIEILIQRLQDLNVPILAIEVPTGIDSNSGVIAGAALPATATLTFLGMKSGLLVGEGTKYSGEIFLNDLQVPVDVFQYVDAVTEICMYHAFQNTYGLNKT
ncbi:sugar kinase [Legionella santicrucis]|uniref:NAD(P)H-hydrate epimerase n=1 Tax=Legionella santicrucis TaxID=45074 RepID=A0A0W0Z2E1_9GAMM|nr:NAD(P)H-hydrate epimerase [Legionella santicrucis]KTD63275.1 sugar kinase [Legionella santicrucis]